MEHQTRQLRETLRQLERRLGLIDDSIKTCCGITLSQCHALVEIGRSSSLSLNDLAALLDLDKSTASRAVDHLVRRGLVSRQPSPASRRHILLGLSEPGEKLFASIESDMHQYYDQVLEQIPAAKRSQVIDSLQILTEAVTKAG